jgi:hypothetical protein
MACALASISYAWVGKCALPDRRSVLAFRSHRSPAGRRLIDFTIRRAHRKEQPMLDFILLALGLGFFALSIAYAFGCDHL